MVKYFFLLLFVSPSIVYAQPAKTLELGQAYELAQKNYPLIRQKDLVKQTASLNIENLRTAFLPQINLNAQATYQSDVTSVKANIPGVNIESASKDQYRVLGEINQLLYDGGVTRGQQNIQELNASVENQKIEVELYKVKERINQLFLGALYLEEQLKQIELLKNDLSTGIKRVEAQVQNGVAFRSNLNLLKAEMLKTEQRAIEISSSRQGFLDALAVFTGVQLSADTRLIKPGLMAVGIGEPVSRPELKLYTEQNRLINEQHRLISAKNKPRASAFAQAGYGRPGLNMLKNDFDFYYTGGLKLAWSLGGLYTRKKEKQLVEINKSIVDIQKETFLLQTNSQLKQQQSEIDKYLKLVESDAEIIKLRGSVKEAAKAQLENGVITANDYIDQVNAEDQARQTLITHQLLLLQAQINYQTLSGKQ